MAVKARPSEKPAGRYVDRHWEFNPAAQGRRGRRAGRYRAFVPDPVADRDFALDAGANAALNRATKALERFRRPVERGVRAGVEGEVPVGHRVGDECPVPTGATPSPSLGRRIELPMTIDIPTGGLLARSRLHGHCRNLS